MSEKAEQHQEDTELKEDAQQANENLLDRFDYINFGLLWPNKKKNNRTFPFKAEGKIDYEQALDKR